MEYNKNECQHHWEISRRNETEIAVLKSELKNMEKFIGEKIKVIVDAIAEMSLQRRNIKKGLIFPGIIMVLNMIGIAIIKWG